MDLTTIAVVFGSIFIVELPDKTFIAALVLSTRYKPLAVWIGVGLAFGVQTLVAVTVGALATLLPEGVVKGVAIAIFLIGAFLLFRTAPGADAAEQEQEEEFAAKSVDDRSFVKAAVASFLVLFAAEWGDLSQLLTITFVGAVRRPRGRVHRRLGRAAGGVRAGRAGRPGAAALHAALAAPLHRVPACACSSRPLPQLRAPHGLGCRS